MAALVLAHRGASARAPENTLAAFALAFDLGADGVELDVRRTADDVLVVRHGAFGARTYAALCAGIPDALRPPTLGEVVDLVRGQGVLDVELKEPGLEEAALAALAGLPAGDVMITSFLPDVLDRLRALAASVRLGLLVRARRPAPLEAFGRSAGASFLAPSRRLCTRGLLDGAAALGVDVAVWTVNDEHLLAGFLAHEAVVAVVTDVPDVAVRVRERGG
jgi:glycerophosphoryl diester phosphodiesterase